MDTITEGLPYLNGPASEVRAAKVIREKKEAEANHQLERFSFIINSELEKFEQSNKEGLSDAKRHQELAAYWRIERGEFERNWSETRQEANAYFWIDRKFDKPLNLSINGGPKYSDPKVPEWAKLQGSDKQSRWAASIRFRQDKQIKKQLADSRKQVTGDLEKEKKVEGCRRAWNTILVTEKRASFWIDNNSTNPAETAANKFYGRKA